jgi:hypothetical protein
LQLGNSPADSVFKALQLLHLHYHPHPEEALAAGHGEINWPLEIARFAGAFWGLAILPILLGFIFGERVFQWFVSWRWKGHYVVCGECFRTLSLVRDLVRQNQRVVLVGRCAGLKSSLPEGVLCLEGDSGDPQLLKRSAVHRASHLIALHEDDHANVETLVAAGKLCARRPAKQPPLEALAHIADSGLESMLREMGESGERLAGGVVREHFFNYYQAIARLLARKFPMPAAIGEGRPRPEQIVIVGFAAFGQSVALKLIRMAQQLYREEIAGEMKWRVTKPKITVVDPRANSLVAEFARRNPRFAEYCELEQCSIDTTDPRFQDLSFLSERDPATRTTLIFCLETESVTSRAISLVYDLSKQARCPVDRIFARIAQPERLGRLLKKLQPENGHPKVEFFAPDSEVFTAKVLLHQNLDCLAREIHKAWLEVEAADRRASNQPTAAGKTWEQLSENDRQGNREAADHLWAKLHMLGFELRVVSKGKRNQSVPNPALLAQLKEREEELALAEHVRWMTWRVLDGWSWGETRDNQKKLHPDIADYDQLPEVTKEKDRVNIRVISKMLIEGLITAVERRNSKSLGGVSQSNP